MPHSPPAVQRLLFEPVVGDRLLAGQNRRL
jgi:hypothetical protein